MSFLGLGDGDINDEEVPIDTRLTAGRACWLGSYGAHTWNYEDNECIWCGPNQLSLKPGRWVDIGNGLSAWQVTS